VANGAARVGGQDVGRVLDPWRALVECVVDGSKRRIFLRCEGNVLPADAVDDDGDWGLCGGVHGGGSRVRRWKPLVIPMAVGSICADLSEWFAWVGRGESGLVGDAGDDTAVVEDWGRFLGGTTTGGHSARLD
jgi:hypothetical protein